MDEKSKERLNKITAKEPHELTKENISFIRARRSYLNKTAKQKFAKELETKKTKK